MVLFLPVVPLDGEIEFVQCGFCRRAFAPSILESDGLRTANSEVEAEVRRKVEETLAGAAASRLLVWETDPD